MINNKRQSVDEIVSSTVKKQSSLITISQNCELVEIGRSYQLSPAKEPICVVTLVVKKVNAPESLEDLKGSPRLTINIKLNGLSDEVQSMQ